MSKLVDDGFECVVERFGRSSDVRLNWHWPHWGTGLPCHALASWVPVLDPANVTCYLLQALQAKSIEVAAFPSPD